MKSNYRLQLSWRVGSLIALTIGLAVGARAQLNYGIIEGVVTDQSGAVVVDASVTVTSVDTGVSTPTKTNSAGYYRAVDLTPGKYRVHIEARGFNSVQVEDVQVFAGQQVRVDRELAVGTTRQTVEVMASQPLLETASANTSTTLESHIIDDMPLQGHDLQQIVYLLPGVQIFRKRPESHGTNLGQQRASPGERALALPPLWLRLFPNRIGRFLGLRCYAPQGAEASFEWP
jgi:hypothetical protein